MCIKESTASSKAKRLERIKIERLRAEMEARLKSEERKIELEMEMSIKLADLTASEALPPGCGRNKPNPFSNEKVSLNRVLFLIKLLLCILHNRSLQKIRQSRRKRW